MVMNMKIVLKNILKEQKKLLNVKLYQNVGY